MTGDAVRQRLAEISARAEAATEGPWEVDRNLPFSPEIVGVFAPGVKRYVVQQDVDGDAWAEDAEEPDGLLAADALFISRSRADVPRLVAALTGTPEKPGVLDLHKFSEAENCCAECEAWWPCPTYRAVAAALEEQP